MYLVVIDESSGQVTATRKAQRGSWAAPLPPFANGATCFVCAPDPRCCSPTGPTSATRRSPMPAALGPPLRAPGTSTLPVAHSVKRIPSRQSAFRSSTASSSSRLVERPFDARPVNRFISRGIFAPFLRAPPLPERASERTRR